MNSTYRLTVFLLIGSLVALSGCAYPMDGYRDNGQYEQNRGGENHGHGDEHRRNCDPDRQGDCHPHEHH